MELGAPQDVIDREREGLAADLFEVWPENWDFLQTFLACAGQWRIGPTGQILGLDYTACKVVLDLSVPDCCAKFHFAALRDFEQGVMEAL